MPIERFRVTIREVLYQVACDTAHMCEVQSDRKVVVSVSLQMVKGSGRQF